MLINISNHPSSEWGKKQKSEALAMWGGVVDIDLPHIDPNLSCEEVIQKASSDVHHYMEIAAKYASSSAFHIMGESVYCYHTIRLIKEAGCTVVASATERVVEYKNNAKLSHFSFVRFREY